MPFQITLTLLSGFFMLRNLLLVALILTGITIGYAQAPSISSFSPSKGPAGSIVKISGHYFNPTVNGNIVYFGTVKALVNAASKTEISVTVPIGASYQPISVLNTANRLAGYSTVPFALTSNSRNSIGAADFDPATNFSLTGKADDTETGDIDGDGKPDIITLNQATNSVSIFKNNSVKGSINSSSFEKKADLVVGKSASDIELSDIDGDGKLDIIVAIADDKTISIFRNISVPGEISKSSFASRVDVNAGNYFPRVIKAGDIDGDGRPDILALSGTNVLILINTIEDAITSTSFQTKTILPNNGASFENATLALADLDADGKLDIAVAPGIYAEKISVYHNVGEVAGSIRERDFSVYKYPTGKGPCSITTADLNEDGRAEIITVNNLDNTLTILENQTNGAAINESSFSSSVSFATIKAPFALTAADLDGDGLPDIAVTNRTNNTLSIFHNKYPGKHITNESFAARADLTLTSASSFLRCADIDGDDRPDIIVQSPQGISIIRNNPSNPPEISSFSPKAGPPGTVITISGKGFNAVSSRNSVWFGAVKGSVVSASEKEMKVKVPVGASLTPFSVLNMDNGRQALSPAPFNITFTTDYDITTADFEYTGWAGFNSNVRTSFKISDADTDGKPDVILYETEGDKVLICPNTAKPGIELWDNFTSPALVLEAGSSIVDLQITDVDGDGKPDIMLLRKSEPSLLIFRNNSTTGTFRFSEPKSYPCHLNKLIVADFNMDGKPDLITGLGFTDCTFKNTSSPGSVSFTSIDSPTRADSFDSVVAADLDNDGKPDIIEASNNGITIYKNVSENAEFSFAKPVKLDIYSELLQVSDIDNDGKPDLIISTSNQISVLKNMTSKGSITAQSFEDIKSFAIPARYGYQLRVSDFNGDGKPDVLISSDVSDKGSVELLQNTSTDNKISFNDPIGLALRYNPTAMEAGDVDMDGRPDILVAAGNAVWLFYNHPLSFELRTPPAITAISPSYARAGETITIEGNHFNTDATKNFVSFGAVSATVVSATANTLKVVVPSGASFAPVSVSNDANKLTAYSSVPFCLTSTSKQSLNAKDFDLPVSMKIDVPFNTSALADLDGDGKTDLVVARGGYFLDIYQNTSKSGKITPSSFVFATRVELYDDYRFIKLADMNGDGKFDILAGGDLIILNRSSPGKFVFNDFNTNQFFAIMETGLVSDLDGDGKPDLVLADSFNPFVVAFNTTLQHMISFAPKIKFGNKSNMPPATGDIDGDGKPDIVATNTESRQLYIYRNISKKGNFAEASLASPQEFDTGLLYPQRTDIVDLDGDGKPEIIVSNWDKASFVVFKNNSSPNKIVLEKIKLNITGGNIRIGNIDGSRKPNLLALGDKEITIFKNNSAPGTLNANSFSPALSIAANQVKDISINDIDNDGKQDLVIIADSVRVFRYNPLSPDLSDTLHFPPLADVTYGSADIALNASLKSGKGVDYTSDSPSVAIVEGSRLKILAAGTTTITAYDPGNPDNFIMRTLKINKASQVISFEKIPDIKKTDGRYAIRATASSGLPVSFKLSDSSIVMVEDGYLVPLKTGTADISASQAGNQNYLAAEPVIQTVNILDEIVSELAARKALSPDGDGVNDFLVIDGIERFPDNTVTITDRNGVKLFEKKGYNNTDRAFDGRSNINSQLLQPGTYFYFVNYKEDGNSKRKSGFFVIKY